MTDRAREILTLVIENYIQTAEPVGSGFLVESAALAVSGATVRNELRSLEEDGYLTHPHTSAGRIPTEKGYRLYVTELMKPVRLGKKEIQLLPELNKRNLAAEDIKLFAKRAAELSHAAAIVAFDRDTVYYTGISNLFAQPEFRNAALTVSISQVLDECEQRIPDVLDLLSEDIHILIGKENPFGNACSLVVQPFQNGFFSILGPMRMSYAKSMSLSQYLQEAM